MNTLYTSPSILAQETIQMSQTPQRQVIQVLQINILCSDGMNVNVKFLSSVSNETYAKTIAIVAL